MSDEKHTKVENTADDFQKGLNEGVKGLNTSDPVVDTRTDQEKEAENQGNQAGKIIKANSDLQQEKKKEEVVVVKEETTTVTETHEED